MTSGTDSITVLRAHDGRRLAKEFSIATNGVVIKRDYDGATWFSAESAPVSSTAIALRLAACGSPA